MTIVMYDSITVSEIPADAPAVAGYVGGHWPTYNELVQKFPHAHHLSIAVNASQSARCLDVEPGDASPAQAPTWFHTHADHSHGLPVLYASASTVAQLTSTMAAAQIGRGQYLIWSAHYTFHEHICSPQTCGYPAADATQWTDKALGRNLDQSCCADYFFAGAPAPAPGPTPPAQEDIVSVSAALNEGGSLHVFVEAKDGSIWYTWQKSGEATWQGGQSGKQIAGLKPFAPAPVK
jgi:hypothetical protein